MAHIWSCAVLWFVILFAKPGFAIDELLQETFPDINKIKDNDRAVHQNKNNYYKNTAPLKLPSLADFAHFKDNDKEKELTEETDNEQEHIDTKRQFNRNTDASFRRQNKFRTVGSSSFSSSSRFVDRTSKASPGGGCSRPQNLKNLQMVCTATTGCKLTCAMRYQFPTGHTELILTCKNATWHVENTNYDVIPSCEPICLPPCQNNGICIEPDKCECPENYSGLQCQYEKRHCLNMPPPIANAHRQCNAKNCKVMCLSGHQFPDGSQVATLMCKEGEWVPARSDWVRVPDCQAICTPPCQNGGQCLTTNLCVCPQAYTGPECQYSVDACSPEKLDFNGGYTCRGSRDSYVCTISCPAGAYFSNAPAHEYVCDYASGNFIPSPVPQCIYESSIKQSTEVVRDSFNFSSFSYGSSESSYTSLKSNSRAFNNYEHENQISYILEKPPKAGDCYIWSGDHIKTFDGSILSFHSDCGLTLVQDAVDNTFSVIVDYETNYQRLKIFAQNKEYIFTAASTGIPSLQVGDQIIPIPSNLFGVTIRFSTNFIEIAFTVIKVNIKWDTKDFVQVHVNENLWNRTGGLCGKFDGYPNNDMQLRDGSISSDPFTFITNWQVVSLKETCNSVTTTTHTCAIWEAEGNNIAEAATKFCSKLLKDPRFAACRAVLNVNVQLYYEACRWDYCSCKENSRESCACNSFSTFMRECGLQGIYALSSWRDNSTCPMQCSGGSVYLPCGPSVQETCGTGLTSNNSLVIESCEEGCYCPPGTVLHSQSCITRDQCPCQLRRKYFQPGETVPRGCNTCTCQAGRWVCTQTHCSARCGAVGDPHYVTFDGRRYDFMGRCSYYLMKGIDYSIETENVACAGSISEALKFSVSSSKEIPSCTKTVTVRYKGQTVRLKQNKEILINGAEVESLPMNISGVYIQEASSIFVTLTLPNALKVWWDGLTRIYIDAPPSFRGQTQGLCGTFNSNQMDDFLTPEGDVEQNIVAFANKWKTKEKCPDVSQNHNHPCDSNIQNKEEAIKYCTKLKQEIFSECHDIVDPEPFYQDCLYDVCSCQYKIGQCLCPILSAYAKECAQQHVPINWRTNVRECGINCPLGQTYQICGNPCARTCKDVSFSPENCDRKECVEGCNCPLGETLNSNGQCIPISQCPCNIGNIEVPSNMSEVHQGHLGSELCICNGGKWKCHVATLEEMKKTPQLSKIQQSCNILNNEEFTKCKPAERITCKNMHNALAKPAWKSCEPGCVCKKGYVFDSSSGQCVLPANCPCHHGGKSYAEGNIIQEDCNTCECKSGKWTCTGKICSGICSAWGDSHFTTFDGKMYDFQGSCDYTLAQGSYMSDSFSISLQNVPCSSLGVTCSKSVSLRVTIEQNVEEITFTQDRPIPNAAVLTRITIRQVGLFVIAEVPDLRLSLKWDKGTRIYVKAGPMWKGLIQGLCGNFNNDQMDDFQTPSDGVEVSPKLFGDSWRLQPHCPQSFEITNTCLDHPERRSWAQKKCGILKSSVFQSCHSEVPFEPYLDRCIFDSCACDLGGDCECFCTAVAAYAYQCNIHGVPIKWRNQFTCPIQCDEKCSLYSPCISSCPVKTCDNIYEYEILNQMCSEDNCIEGCEFKPCPPSQVYFNLTSLECTPISKCERQQCLEIDGNVYFEGDLIEKDDCHKCYCSRQRKTCIGQPCSPTVPPSVSDNDNICVSGWTDWINSDKPKPDDYSDIEPIPPSIMTHKFTSLGYGQCSPEKISAIECRLVGINAFDSKNGTVICSIQDGLICANNCEDYEIRVYCQCEPECSVEQPHIKHPDCQKFYHCEKLLNGTIQLVEKICGPGTLFNPFSMICDYPQNVIQLRPECGSELRPPTLETTETTVIIPTVTLPTVTITTVTTQSTLSPIECQSGWSNIINSTRTEMGDFERIKDLLSEGRITCLPEHITDIDCIFLKYTQSGISSLMHFNESDDVAICKPDKGLVCYNSQQIRGLCADYAIRVFCNCGEVSHDFGTESWSTSSIKEIISTTETPTSTETLCPPNHVWKECGYACNQLCHYYSQTIKKYGFCKEEDKCIAGCIPQELFSGCPFGSKWRNNNTCVLLDDCTCMSEKGHHVAPGDIFVESDCKVCQCIQNEYICAQSSCSTSEEPIYGREFTRSSPKIRNRVFVTTTLIPYTSEENILSTSTASPSQTVTSTMIVNFTTSIVPPPPCVNKRPLYLTEIIPQISFKSSNNMNSEHSAEQAHFIKGNGWISSHTTADEYLQIDLGHIEPVYGVVCQGVLGTSQYVTSYNVLYSTDGVFFTYIKDNSNSVKIFRGPIDDENPSLQWFDTPVDARYIRFNPQTWHKGIAMRVDIISCAELSTVEYTTVSPTTIPATSTGRVCVDRMGLENGLLNDQQLRSSSSYLGDIKNYGAKQGRLNNHASWIAGFNDNRQWLEVDFLEQTLVSALITQGDQSGKGWVEAFHLQYSHDGENWITILNQQNNAKEFPANFDGDTPHTIDLERIINTRFLKIQPTKWHKHIALRIEVIGCYHPYNLPTTPKSAYTEPPCPVCSGVPIEQEEGFGNCSCGENLLWNGEKCVKPEFCPCFVGYKKYEVGQKYDTARCETCICSLQGIPECRKMKCKPCEKDYKETLTSSCKCLCEACPVNTILCPTNNICIDARSWCDGIDDCEDDEKFCQTTERPETSVTPVINECPKPDCPEGFILVELPPTKYPLGKYNPRPMNKFGGKGFPGKGLKGIKGRKILPKPNKIICAKYACHPITTPAPQDDATCPPPISCDPPLILLEFPDGQCSSYYCENPPPPDVVCNVTGITFNTFDGTIFKYAICNHVLARNMRGEDDNWDISVNKNCSNKMECYPFLSVKHNGQLINIRSDLSIEFEKYTYSSDQIQKIGAQNDFVVSQVGDNIYFKSLRFEFWIKWTKGGNLKIGVPGKLSGSVDGLCGYFNGNPKDDKQKPDGSSARTTTEFGNSWSINEIEEECKPFDCPTHIQNTALRICATVKKNPFLQCKAAVNIDNFISQCLETACACLQSPEMDLDICRCKTLETFVTECHMANSSVDLSSWRIQQDCPVSCPNPLEYRECYQRECEPSCTNLRDSCSYTQKTCFSGCFCPDGLVRKGDACVRASECRDCVCSGFGDQQYITYDHTNFTFNGNCSFVASRDISPTGLYDFEVLISNTECPNKLGSTCTEAVTIHHSKKVISLKRNLSEKPEYSVAIDGIKVENLPYTDEIVQLKKSGESIITLLIPSIQLEVAYFFKEYGFIISIPSHLYGGEMEGICGDCNKETENDLLMSNSLITKSIPEFSKSWLSNNYGNTDNCITPLLNECENPPPNEDPCLILYDGTIFGKCHNLVNPDIFVKRCHDHICHIANNTASICKDLEGYARECLSQGLCMDWRLKTNCFMKCTEGLEYRPCSSGCLNTCDDYRKSKNFEEKCRLSEVEGCFCPEGQVLEKESCVNISHCLPCDNEGHYEGDVWKIGNCTTCQCKDFIKACKTIECPENELKCGLHGVITALPLMDGECCQKYTCNYSTPNCTEMTSKPKCADDQELKIIVNEDGCNTFVCQCLPCNNSEFVTSFNISNENSLPPGYEKKIDTSGCCPKMIAVCNVSICPKPHKCEDNYNLLELPPLSNSCCPQYACEPRKDGCFYKMLHKNSGKGGEANRSQEEELSVFKMPGEEWKDGPCHTCRCEGRGPYQAICPAKQCTSIIDDDYVVEEKLIYGECCPEHVKTACKDKGKIYKIGDSWKPEDGNPCILLSCQDDLDGVKKTLTKQQCNTQCDAGYQYYPSTSEDKCCGECREQGCIFEGKLYPETTTWHSDDKCTQYFCLQMNGTFQIDAATITCPNQSVENTNEFAVEYDTVDGECCKKPKFIGCLVDNKLIQFGENYTSLDVNPCETVLCTFNKTSGKPSRSVQIKECAQCSVGWEYIPPLKSSNECCGICEQKFCIHNGTHYNEGDSWTSTDGCINFSCINIDKQLQVIMNEPNCPKILDCPKDLIVDDGCCKKCEYKCKAHTREKSKTIQLIREQNEHGICLNSEEIPEFMECKGSCPSSYSYNKGKSSYVTECLCCKEKGHKTVSVELVCEDDFRYKTNIKIPVSCSCDLCSAPFAFEYDPSDDNNGLNIRGNTE